jgi:tRNA-splicing ligase RtcB (3'-phosphate/5'-hydroxy nucleic acid ligase)
MPGGHWGNGFPIGRVAAADIDRGGTVSPGSVRLLSADLCRTELAPVIGSVVDQLAAAIPCGAGRGGTWRVTGWAELEKLLLAGRH